MSTSAAARFGKRDALARDADIVLQVLGDVVARFEIGGHRRPVVRLGDAAEDIVGRDPPPRTQRPTDLAAPAAPPGPGPSSRPPVPASRARRRTLHLR